MTIRTIALISGLAIVLGGCVVTPRTYVDRTHYYDNDSYEGYSYARVIYIDNTPYYVDEDRRARPVPPHLRDRFRYAPSNGRSMPPSFSRDAGMRDGYAVSRVVYINDVPHYVEDDHRARPLPRQLHEHFRYTPPVVSQGNGRPLPQVQQRPEPAGPVGFVRDAVRPAEPPAYGRDRDRERFEPPAYGRDRDRRNGMNDDPRQRQDMRQEAPQYGNNGRPGDRPMPLPPVQQRPEPAAPVGFVRDAVRPEPAAPAGFVRPEPPAYGRDRDPRQREEVRREVPPPGNNGRGPGDDRPQENGAGNDRAPGLVNSLLRGRGEAANPPNRVEEPRGNPFPGNGRGRGDEHSQGNQGNNGNDRGQGRVMSVERNAVAAPASPAVRVDEPRGNPPPGNGRGRGDERSQKNNGRNDKEQDKVTSEERRGMGNERGRGRD